MSFNWTRVDSGKYKLVSDGWNFIVELKDSLRGGSRYKYQLYENMRRPQSASALEVEIKDEKLRYKKGCRGDLEHIRNYISVVNAFDCPGIPEPLRSNFVKALDIATISDIL